MTANEPGVADKFLWEPLSLSRLEETPDLGLALMLTFVKSFSFSQPNVRSLLFSPCSISITAGLSSSLSIQTSSSLSKFSELLDDENCWFPFEFTPFGIPFEDSFWAYLVRWLFSSVQ